ELEYNLSELAELIKNTDKIPFGTVIQKRYPDINYLFGPGKIKEVKERAQTEYIEAVVFNQELSPRQVKALEGALPGLEVWDRTQIILDIFGRRARSREGKIQVELAQLTYLYPRMLGLGGVLSRLGGGIGTRGPGETKLEEMRRFVRRRIKQLRDEEKEIKQSRTLLRKQRQRSGIRTAALIGYTNAGKSTLLNALSVSDHEVLAENRLFVTLDPVSRRVMLPSGREFLLSDTVGFVRDMPTRVQQAFRATLEELTEADVLVEVIDITSPYRDEQEAAVEQVIKDLELEAKPRLRVYNKADAWRQDFPLDGITVSARERIGLDQLLIDLDELLYEGIEVRLLVPFSRLGELGRLRPRLEVVNENYNDQGLDITVRGRIADLQSLQDMMIPSLGE
ncbi:MAG: GTPase HflX, partial [Methylocystaceae bacterium]